jgi:hypothetical protein
MTTHATSSSRATRTLDLPRVWLTSRRNQAIAAFALYAVIAIVYFGLQIVLHPRRDCACQSVAGDPAAYMWSLAWWPHALLHGLNPFVTNMVFAPDHVDLAASGAMIASAGIVAAPLTLLFGPIVSYNVIMLAAPLLAAFFAFLLCRYITRSFAAALVGGYLFGFSAYMLSHMIGHLNLVLIFPIPAGVHLTLRLIDQRIGERGYIALMALVFIALLLSATELAFTSVALGAVALAVAFALAPAARPRLIAAIKPILLAGAAAALVVSPVIYYGLKGVVKFPPTVSDLYNGDALGFLVPTHVIRLGRGYFAPVSARFSSGAFAEAGLYVGLPFALIVAHQAITRWRLVATRILVVMLAVVVVLLFGSHLHIAGYPTIPLPWKLINYSLVRELLPVRLGVYMFLIVAVIAAMWLAQPVAGGRAQARWALAAVGIVFLIPNLGTGLWHRRVHSPSFFTTHQYRSALKRGETVLVVPTATLGEGMLWQAETGMWFRLAGGYLGTLIPPDYGRDPLLAALLGDVKPDPQVLRTFLTRHDVGAVIVDPANPQQWPQALAALGLKPVSVGGVWLYRV